MGCETGSKSRVQAYFDAVAEGWDTLREGYFDETVIVRAIEVADPQPHWVVADVGTGTGFVAAGLAGLVSRVIGVDLSEKMLEVARRNCAARGIANVEFRQGDAESLPLATGEVDALFGNMILHHAPAPPRAIQEMARALRPGGCLVLTDTDSHEEEALRRDMADLWLGFDRGDIRRWYEAVGLRDVRIEDVGTDCCATLEGGKPFSVPIWIAIGRKGTR